MSYDIHSYDLEMSIKYTIQAYKSQGVRESLFEAHAI